MVAASKNIQARKLESAPFVAILKKIIENETGEIPESTFCKGGGVHNFMDLVETSLLTENSKQT